MTDATTQTADPATTAEPPADARPYSPGLEGVVGAESAIGLVDGKNGRLLYRGYPIGQLVARGTYAEVADLLWTGEWHPGVQFHPAAVPEPVLVALRALPRTPTRWTPCGPPSRSGARPRRSPGRRRPSRRGR